MNIVSVLIFLTVLMSRVAFAGEQQVAAALQDRFFDSNFWRGRCGVSSGKSLKNPSYWEPIGGQI